MPFDFSVIHVPFRMQPGLRRLAAQTRQLTPLGPADAAFDEKLHVIERHASRAFVSVPGFDARPALLAAARQAATDDAGIECDGRTVMNRSLGLAVDVESGGLTRLSEDASLAAQGAAAAGSTGNAEIRDAQARAHAAIDALAPHWRAAALLALSVRADLAVVDGATGQVPWIAACLPSHWSPEEKVGRHFAQVHAPVADNATLLAAGDHLMRLVCGSDRWERHVWTLTRHGRHDQHPARHVRLPWPDSASPEEIASLCFLRSERQTFIPVEGAAQAVFTIEIEVQPLQSAVTRAGHAALLRQALASMSPAVLEYRGLTTARDRLLQWLDAMAAR